MTKAIKMLIKNITLGLTDWGLFLDKYHYWWHYKEKNIRFYELGYILYE